MDRRRNVSANSALSEHSELSAGAPILDLGNGACRVGSTYLVDRENGTWAALNVCNGAAALLDSDHQNYLLSGDFSAAPGMMEMFAWEGASIEGNPGLHITVEVTRSCNLRCSYCSQSDWPSLGPTEIPSLEALAQYCADQATGGTTRKLRVEFIGGEPLLALQKIKILATDLAVRGIDFDAVISTNGTHPLEPILAILPRLYIETCLSLPEDHLRMRPAKTIDSVESALENLRRAAPTSTQRIWLRYQTHAQNMAKFEEYLDWVDSQKLEAVRGIRVERIRPTEAPRGHICYVEQAEFLEWKEHFAVPALLSRGWPYPDSIFGFMDDCAAHTPGSLKLLSDGRVVPCGIYSNMSSPSAPHVGLLASKTTVWQKEFDSRLGVSGRTDECSGCSEVFHCRGRIACMDFTCPSASDLRRQDAKIVNLMRNHWDQIPQIVTAQLG